MNFFTYRLRLIITAVILTLTGILARQPLWAEAPAQRLLKIKERISSPDAVIRLKDIVSNLDILTDSERDFAVTETPVERDRQITLIQLAFMLQKHSELMNTKLRGPARITLKRQNSDRYLEKAKKQIISYIKKNPPWDSWQIELLFNANDELLISKVGPFETLKIFPYENKAMLGTVGFRVAFFDKYGREVGKSIINPVIQRKVMISVVKNNCRLGHILRKSDIKKVPVWTGGEKKDFVVDEKNCIGRELAKDLTAGDIIRDSDLLSPVCAKRGDLIWVNCTSGALSVQVAVEAQQNGRKGDSIRVKNKSSKKIFSVKLIGDKKAVYEING